MSSPDIVTTFTANDQDVIKAMGRQQKEIERLQAQVKKLNDASQDGWKNSSRFLEAQVQSVVKLAASYVSVQSAVAAVTAAYREWSQALDESNRKTIESGNSIIRTLAKVGALEQRGALQRRFAARGIDSEVAASALEGALATPDGISVERAAQIAETTSRLSPIEGVQGVRGLAQSVGQLDASLGGRFSAADTLDRLLIARTFVGNRSDALTQQDFAEAVKKFTEAGMSPDRAMAISAAAISQGVPMDTLQKLAVRAKDRSTLTGENGAALIENAIADPQMNAGLLENNKMVAQLRELSGQRDKISEITKQLGGADARDIASEQLKSVEGVVGAGDGSSDAEIKAQRQAQVERMRQLFFRELKTIDAMRSTNMLISSARNFGINAMDAQISETDAAGMADLFTRQMRFESLRNSVTANAADNAAAKAVADRFEQSMKAMVAALEENTKATRDDARRNNRGPNNADLDRHAEPAVGGL